MIDQISSKRQNLLGLHAKDGDFIEEANQVIDYYEFYEGTPAGTDKLPLADKYGQMWAVPNEDKLDYKPTRTVRNHVKKLINKQGRFMFSIPPTIAMKPYDGAQKNNAEEKRAIIDKILDACDFWTETAKAFIDSTIGKRVLLVVIANKDEPIGIKYYTMPEFKYTVDPNDYTRLIKVEISYQDESTLGKVNADQRWHQWIYYMENDTCKCIYKLVDGDGNQAFKQEQATDEDGTPLGEPTQVPILDKFDTGLSMIPCKVICNGGLTGDIYGTSDVKDLIDCANEYNQINSDFRDALKFRMFEQPVFTDADSDSIADVKIAPNAVIDLKTDPSIGDGTGGSSRSAQVTTLTSTFNFAVPADSYLDRLKKDMYELMDQPLPENLAMVASGKAMGYMFYDLIARCDQKWNNWEPAIKWLIDIICESVSKLKLYKEMQAEKYLSTETNVIIKHNYPIPEDIEDTKGIAIREVEANVMSRKTYIRTYGDVEDENTEWEEILAESSDLSSSTNSFETALDDQLDETNTEDEPKDEDDKGAAGKEDEEVINDEK